MSKALKPCPTAKTRYSEGQVVRQLRYLKDDTLTSYHCNQCGKWHIKKRRAEA